MTLPVERYNEPACFDRFAEMTSVMGIDTSGMTQIEASDRWFIEIEKFSGFKYPDRAAECKIWSHTSLCKTYRNRML
jgi:hypothetical protein